MGVTLMVTTYTSFSEAQESRTTDDDGAFREMVCGTLLESGQPVYFLARAGSPEPAVRELSFQIRHGRPISGYERFLLNAAEDQAGGLHPSLEVAGADAD
jgi:hypothetical protein